MRQVCLDPARGFNEIYGITIMFRNARGNGKYVRVKDNVFRRKAIRDQQLVGPFADFDLAGESIGLTFFVKGHHDHRCTILASQVRLA